MRARRTVSSPFPVREFLKNGIAPDELVFCRSDPMFGQKGEHVDHAAAPSLYRDLGHIGCIQAQRLLEPLQCLRGCKTSSLSIYPQPSTDGSVTFSYLRSTVDQDPALSIDILTADGRVVASFSNWDGGARSVSLETGYYVADLRGAGGRRLERRAFVVSE